MKALLLLSLLLYAPNGVKSAGGGPYMLGNDDTQEGEGTGEVDQWSFAL